MELKLNIWGKANKQRVILKTYTATTYDLMLGTCDDLIGLLELEKYTDERKVAEVPVNEILQLIIKNYDKFIDLLHDIFPDLTEEDHKGIKVSELKDVFLGVAKHTLGGLFNLKTKN